MNESQIDELILNAQTYDPSKLMYYDFSESKMVRRPITVCRDPAIPSEDPKVDRQKLQEWINGHKGSYRPIAQKLANNIQYFSFERFYQVLIDTITILNMVYEEDGIQGDEVIIAVPWLLSDKSNNWVTSLLLRNINFKPYALVECGNTEFLKEYLKEHPHIKRVILADDAAYSGTDLSVLIRNITDGIDGAKSNTRLSVVVPFISNRAKNKFLSEQTIHLFYGHVMPTIAELSELTAEEKGLLGGFGKLVLSYFAHKLADNYSVPEKFMKYGLNLDPFFTYRGLDQQNKRYCKAHDEPKKFIPDITPCYKEQEPKRRLSSYQHMAPLQQAPAPAKV